jgi:hypothetical protein
LYNLDFKNEGPAKGSQLYALTHGWPGTGVLRTCLGS